MLDQVGPELLRNFKSFGNFYGLAGFYRSIRKFGRVIQFTKSGVAGSGVVPGIGAFGSSYIQAFKNFDGKVGYQFFHHHTQSSAHNSSPDQDYAWFGNEFFIALRHSKIK